MLINTFWCMGHVETLLQSYLSDIDSEGGSSDEEEDEENETVREVETTCDSLLPPLTTLSPTLHDTVSLMEMYVKFCLFIHTLDLEE